MIREIIKNEQLILLNFKRLSMSLINNYFVLIVNNIIILALTLQLTKI